MKEAASDARPMPVHSAAPHEVLTAMGEEGRLRACKSALWEYYNVWCETRPGFGKPAMLTYKEGSYVNDLFHALQEHLSASSILLFHASVEARTHSI